MVEKRILVGQIGAAHGIRGEVRVKSFTVPMEAIADYGPLASEDGASTLEIQRMRNADTVLVVKFKGVEDRNRAETLNGTRLFVDREALPEPEDEETFYQTDLIGLRAEGADGTVYGQVLAVPDFGAGDLLEIQPPEGSTVYLPFTKVFAPAVDLAGGRIVIDPPAGLFGGGEADANEPKPDRPPRRRKGGGTAENGGSPGGEPAA